MNICGDSRVYLWRELGVNNRIAESNHLLATMRIVAVSMLALVSFASHAETDSNPLEKLEEIELQVRRDRQQAEGLSQSAAKFARDQTILRERLIQAAALAQARERDLNQVEQRLAMFETQEASARKALDGQQTKLAQLLAVLQRMGREPPPALVVRPDNATAAARSAMLLSSVVPAVQKQASQLAKNLGELRLLRQRTAAERLKVAAASGSLEKDRAALTHLLDQRRLLTEQASQNLQSTKDHILELGEQARDLRALITSLREDGARPGIRKPGNVVTNQIASAGSARTVPLDALRGRLKLPANGRLAAGFGSNDGAGGQLAGIYLDTLPGSGVTSPCDGKIMFAGPFRGYGQMLIISANGGYHVLLAGLTNIDGVVGQVVLAGEPLGRMGRDRTSEQPGAQRGIATDAPQGKRLYVEFRRNDVPVDPVPWFAAFKERVSG